MRGLIVPLTPEQYLKPLSSALTKVQRPLMRLDAYYEGLQPLNFIAPELFCDLSKNLVELVINWPRLGTDAYNTRLAVQGFRFGTAEDADEDLWGLWLRNRMPKRSRQAHLEALIMGRSYAFVGSREGNDSLPLITVEHPLQVMHRNDPRTGDVEAAIKRWTDQDGQKRVTLYLPNETRQYVMDRGFRELKDELSEHGMGKVPVVPIVNRERLLRPLGVSEFQDVMIIADAANKMATDMMISADFHAMPRRWVFGMSEDDFADETGKALSTWSAIAGRLWATEKNPKDVAAGQFPEADLTNFHNSIKLLAQIAQQMLGLPPHYMSHNADNPTSAASIEASEAQMVQRCRDKHIEFADPWEQVMRLALRIRDGEWDEDAEALSTDWRSPETPSTSQSADAASKLVGGPVLPREGAWDDLGYSPQRKIVLRRQWAEQQAADSADLFGDKPPVDDIDPADDPVLV